ncbi:hypothetical protein ES703_93861 [subsurface metagenome]
MAADKFLKCSYLPILVQGAIHDQVPCMRELRQTQELFRTKVRGAVWQQGIIPGYNASTEIPCTILAQNYRRVIFGICDNEAYPGMCYQRVQQVRIGRIQLVYANLPGVMVKVNICQIAAVADDDL